MNANASFCCKAGDSGCFEAVRNVAEYRFQECGGHRPSRYPRPMSDSAAGLYVHVPFCAVRCDYCNFAIVAGQDRRIPQFVEALSHEAALWGGRLPELRYDTLHFGGGTPSRLPGDRLARLIQILGSVFRLESGAEIALEANPEDVSVARVRDWRDAGVTRVTVGVQSRRSEGLRSIGRPGAIEDADNALSRLADGGIASVGVDLIFGRPEQSVTDWSLELSEMLELPFQHLSLYALETDGRTPLTLQIERGERQAPSSDDAAAMYEEALRQLQSAGFDHYEISNFALPGHISRHNLKYWIDAPYLGLGPSAASYVAGERWTQPPQFEDWRLAVAADRFPTVEPFDADRRAGEAMVFGMRALAGISIPELIVRYGNDPVMRRKPVFDRAVQQGLVIFERERVRLTTRGLLLADEVFVDLL